MATAVLKATFNFSSEETAPGAFEFPFVKRVSTGGPLHLKAVELPVHDLRNQALPSLDIEGFTWCSLPFDDLDGQPGWEERYAKESCKWLKTFVGAQMCIPMNTQVRRRTIDVTDTHDEEEKKLGMQPVSAVHVDAARDCAVKRLVAAFGDEEFSTKRIAFLNIWRPLKGPVMDVPLAVCDARGVDFADMDRTFDRYGIGYFVQYNSKMRWMYIRNQTPDEILIFRQFDSAIEPISGAAAAVPHSAFVDESRKHEGLPRESIELRCAVVY